MHWGLLATGFGFGTFKFLFAHWAIAGIAAGKEIEIHAAEIFISVTAGAWFSMTVFYFMSGFFMRRAKAKRNKQLQQALERGEEIKRKKVFTRANKLIVWIKRKFGIYGVSLLAPLFLSIPLGSIVCAKFYGQKKRTFPLMMFFTGTYSFLMSLWIYLVQ